MRRRASPLLSLLSSAERPAHPWWPKGTIAQRYPEKSRALLSKETMTQDDTHLTAENLAGRRERGRGEEGITEQGNL